MCKTLKTLHPHEDNNTPLAVYNTSPTPPPLNFSLRLCVNVQPPWQNPIASCQTHRPIPLIFKIQNLFYFQSLQGSSCLFIPAYPKIFFGVTGKIHYHAQLGLPEKDRSIKGLVLYKWRSRVSHPFTIQQMLLWLLQMIT